jgi:hypothetical protein
MTGTPSAGPTASGGVPGRQRYVVGSDEPELLRSIAERFTTTGEARVDHVIGAGPAAIVIEAAEGVAQRLRAEHGDRVIVEEDIELPQPGPVLPPGM